VRRDRNLSAGHLAAQTLGLVFIAGVVIVAPRLAEGYGALQWVRFHSRLVGASHGADHARRAGHSAARVVDLAAPLPWAREASGLALEAAQSLGARNTASAAAVYLEVRGALDRAQSSPVRGHGMEDVAARARKLDDEARTRASGATP
jgi:hypothetical protein